MYKSVVFLVGDGGVYVQKVISSPSLT